MIDPAVILHPDSYKETDSDIDDNTRILGSLEALEFLCV